MFAQRVIGLHDEIRMFSEQMESILEEMTINFSNFLDLMNELAPIKNLLGVRQAQVDEIWLVAEDELEAFNKRESQKKR